MQLEELTAWGSDEFAGSNVVLSKEAERPPSSGDAGLDEAVTAAAAAARQLDSLEGQRGAVWELALATKRHPKLCCLCWEGHSIYDMGPASLLALHLSRLRSQARVVVQDEAGSLTVY